MEKAKILSIIYEESDSIEKQGNRVSIERYLENGYYVKESRNGYWVLVKPVRVNVTLSNSYGTNTFNMKDDICNYYQRARISESLVERFKDDVAKGEINIYMNKEGCYLLE